MTHWIVLVPKGAEAQAVQRGFARRSQSSSITLMEVPAGQAVRSFLENQISLASKDYAFLVLGLCGSLSDRLPIGTPVLYYPIPGCSMQPPLPLIPVMGSTSDRVLTTVADKRAWADSTGALVADMEGDSIVAALEHWGVPIVTIRVVSDDLGGDIPDLSQVFDIKGQLKPISLAIAFLREPIAAIRLIRASLQALQKLAQVCQDLPLELETWIPEP